MESKVAVNIALGVLIMMMWSLWILGIVLFYRIHFLAGIVYCIVAGVFVVLLSLAIIEPRLILEV